MSDVGGTAGRDRQHEHAHGDGDDSIFDRTDSSSDCRHQKEEATKNANDLVLAKIFGDDAASRALVLPPRRRRRSSSVEKGGNLSPPSSSTAQSKADADAEDKVDQGEADENLSLAIGILRVLLNDGRAGVSADDVWKIAGRLLEEEDEDAGDNEEKKNGDVNGAKSSAEEEAEEDARKPAAATVASRDELQPLQRPSEESPKVFEEEYRRSGSSGTPPQPPNTAATKNPSLPKPKTQKSRPDVPNPSKETKPAASRPTAPALDPSVRYRPVALRFHYDGSAFASGFAENVGSPGDDSVERALFDALKKTRLVVDRSSCKYSRAGRTDRGVSAWGQTVGLNLRSAFPKGCRRVLEGEEEEAGAEGEIVRDEDLPRNSRAEVDVWVPPKMKKPKKKKRKKGKGKDQEDSNNNVQEAANGGVEDDGATKVPQGPMVRRTLSELDYPKMLNAVLPPTIRVFGWCPVTPAFSARFSCSARTYRYYFVKRDLDLEAMREGLAKLVGRHDFRNLCKMNVEEVSNFERVIHSAEIVESDVCGSGGEGGESMEEDGDDAKELLEPRSFRRPCHFLIVGQAFLWHQIRCIVSVLFMIGHKLEPPSIIDSLLDVTANPGKPSYEMAPELPLVLHSTEYLNLKMGYGVTNLWHVGCDLERKWEELQLAAERLRDGWERLGREAFVSREDVERFVEGRREDRRRKGIKAKGNNKRLLPEEEIVSPPRKRRLTSDKDGGTSKEDIGQSNGDGDGNCSPSDLIPWFDALSVIRTSLSGLRPSPSGPREAVHVPLMSRSRGTTYEEKVKALLAAGGRRREIYESNIVGKKGTREEDDKFHDEMLRQGGTGQ